MSEPGTYTEEDLTIILKQIKSDLSRNYLVAQDAIYKHRESRLGIFVKTADIRNQGRGTYNQIHCKARLINPLYSTAASGILENDCYVACGHWHKLGKLEGDTINILAHTDKLLPRHNRGCIGLFTYQNGIQNNLEQFKKMGQSILAQLNPEKPLCIGLYNETNGVLTGFLKDHSRMQNEWMFNSYSAVFIRQMLITFSALLRRINPGLLFAHLAHSEAALIANKVLTDRQHHLGEAGDLLKKQLVTAIYGGVSPIPDSHVLQAINTYSNDDVTLLFVKKFLDKTPCSDKTLQTIQDVEKRIGTNSAKQVMAKVKQQLEENYIDKYPYTCTKDDHTITVVQSLVPKESQSMFKGWDHSFTEDTYQAALKEDIKFIRGIHKIYDAQMD